MQRAIFHRAIQRSFHTRHRRLTQSSSIFSQVPFVGTASNREEETHSPFSASSSVPANRSLITRHPHRNFAFLQYKPKSDKKEENSNNSLVQQRGWWGRFRALKEYGKAYGPAFAAVSASLYCVSFGAIYVGVDYYGPDEVFATLDTIPYLSGATEWVRNRVGDSGAVVGLSLALAELTDPLRWPLIYVLTKRIVEYRHRKNGGIPPQTRKREEEQSGFFDAVMKGYKEKRAELAAAAAQEEEAGEELKNGKRQKSRRKKTKKQMTFFENIAKGYQQTRDKTMK